MRDSNADSESDGNLPLATAITKMHSSELRRDNHYLDDKRMHTEIAKWDSFLLLNIEKIGCSMEGNRT